MTTPYNTMTTPSKKSPEMEALLEGLFRRTSSIEANICSFCKGPANEFRDELSRKEFTISALCQNCQDSAFNEPSDWYEYGMPDDDDDDPAF